MTNPNAPMRPDWLGIPDTEFVVAPDSSTSNPHRGQVFYEPNTLTDAVAMREMLRVALMPEESAIPPRSEIDPDILAAVNNMRIAHVMRTELGVTPEPIAPIDNIKSWLSNATRLKYARRARLHVLNALGTTAEPEIGGYIDTSMRRFQQTLAKQPVLTWADVIAYSQYVQGWLDREEAERQQQEGGGSGSGDGDSDNNDPRTESNTSDHGRDDYRPDKSTAWMKGMDWLDSTPTEDDMDDKRREIARHMATFPQNDVGWGIMHVEFAELVQDHPARSSARKVRPREYGDTLRFIDRDLTDDRVFGSMRPVKGGTILIDNSGSMGLSIEQVWALITEAPYAEIAHYDGWRHPIAEGGGYSHANHGRVKVVAHHGRVAHREDLVRARGHNIIDGPALDWLQTRKRPFLWVSDGHVTGRDENSPPRLKQYADLACMRGHIRRAPDVESAIKLLRSGGFR